MPPMRVSKTKGINPRHHPLKDALNYDDIMGSLIAHSKADNSAEISTIRRSLSFVAESVFRTVKQRLLLRVPKREDYTSEAEFFTAQIRHNDSVAFVKSRHAQTINKISKSKFGYKGAL